MKLFVFGSSLTSSYWNGAATYYRGIYKNLAELGFQITFAEPDAYGRQQHRDNEDFSYAEVIVYDSPRDIPMLLKRAREADLVIKHSGVGVGGRIAGTAGAGVQVDRRRRLRSGMSMRRRRWPASRLTRCIRFVR